MDLVRNQVLLREILITLLVSTVSFYEDTLFRREKALVEHLPF